MPNLRVTVNNEQQLVPLTEPRCTIGRSSDCDLHLEGDGLSRHHACVYLAEGQWRVQDLGSANGTLLNGRMIEDNPLNTGDTIALGANVAITFEGDGAETVTAVPAAEITTETAMPVAEVAAETVPTATAAVIEIAQPAAPPPPAVHGASVSLKAVGTAREVSADQVQEIVQRMSENTKRIEAEISKAIIGQKEVLWQLLTAIISSGHVLMIGMPGLAKTKTISTLSEVLDLKFRRIQFTPDLMPSDITGTDVLEVDDKSGKKEYRFIQGPIFTNILLADEINRTPPKTQAALLEAMQEHRVTASGHTYQLSLPFFVLATQNPLEQEGTYPLPEAQLDRFMFSVYIDYPEEKDEETIAKVTTSTAKPDLHRVLTGAEILELQQVVRNMPVSEHVIRYAVRLVRATRPGDKRAPDFIKKWIHCGAGPRASQYLLVAAKARAVINGRLLVTADDIRASARPVLRHRMFTNFTADSEGMDTDKIVQQLVQAVAEPGEGDY
jgi:MoxR-like ATPase